MSVRLEDVRLEAYVMTSRSKVILKAHCEPDKEQDGFFGMV